MNDQQNGTNGYSNGNGKGIFGLTSNEDAKLLPVLKEVVPRARRKVCENTNIPESARMFFCWLTDQSLLPGVNSRPGVVKFSDSYLSHRFKVNEKTVRNWKRWIESTGEMWLTEKWMKNSFPQTVYNITAIVGQATLPFNMDSEDGSLPDDEVFSSNRRRQQATKRDGSGKFSCRLHGVPGCELCRLKPTPPGIPARDSKTATLQISEENEPSGNILPPTTANGCRPPRQMVAAHRGKSLPSATANGCRPARQMVAAVDGKSLPPSAANGCRSDRQTVAENGEAQDKGLGVSKGNGGSPTPDEAFERWTKSLDAQFPSHLRRLEKTILGKLETTSKPNVREGLKRQLKAVRDRLLPPVPDDEPAQPVRAIKPGPKPMPLEQRRALAAKYNLKAAVEAGR